MKRPVAQRFSWSVVGSPSGSLPDRNYLGDCCPTGKAPSSPGAICCHDPLQVLDRGELDGQPALAAAESDPAPGCPAGPTAGRPGRRAPPSCSGPWPAGGRRPGRRRRPRSPRPSAPTAPRPRSAGPAAPSPPSRPGRAGRARGRPTAHPRRAGAAPAGAAAAAAGCWRSAGASDRSGGQLVVGAAEVVQQLLVGRGLLERVELAAVQVLQQGVPQQVVLGGLPDDGRHGCPGRPAGWPASAARP